MRHLTLGIPLQELQTTKAVLEQNLVQLASELKQKDAQLQGCEKRRRASEDDFNQMQEGAEQLIRELNTENQNLTEKIAEKQNALSQLDASASAAARQVHALKMALDIQQRKSGTFNDVQTMQHFFHASSASSPSQPSVPILEDMQHVPHVVDAPSNFSAAKQVGHGSCGVAQEVLACAKEVDETRHELALLDQRSQKRLEDLEREFHELTQFQHTRDRIALSQSRETATAAVRRLRQDIQAHTKHLEGHVNNLSLELSAAEDMAKATVAAGIRAEGDCKAECEALIRMLKVTRRMHADDMCDREKAHSRKLEAARQETADALAQMSALKMIAASSAREFDDEMEEEAARAIASNQKYEEEESRELLMADNRQLRDRLDTLLAQQARSRDVHFLTTQNVQSLISDLVGLCNIASDVREAWTEEEATLNRYADAQSRFQAQLIGMCAELRSLEGAAAKVCAASSSDAKQGLSLKMEVKELNAIVAAARDEVKVSRNKAFLLQQELQEESDRAAELASNFDGAKASCAMLQQEVLNLQEERDNLSRGMQSLDGAKSKQLQTAMDLQGQLAKSVHEADAEKRKRISIEQSMAGMQQQHTAELERARAATQAANDAAGSLQLAKDLVAHQLCHLQQQHGRMEEEMETLRLQHATESESAHQLQGVETGLDCVDDQVDAQIKELDATLKMVSGLLASQQQHSAQTLNERQCNATTDGLQAEIQRMREECLQAEIERSSELGLLRTTYETRFEEMRAERDEILSSIAKENEIERLKLNERLEDAAAARKLAERQLADTLASLSETRASKEAREGELQLSLASRVEEVHRLRGAAEMMESLQRDREEELQACRERKATADARLEEEVRAHAGCSSKIAGLEERVASEEGKVGALKAQLISREQEGAQIAGLEEELRSARIVATRMEAEMEGAREAQEARCADMTAQVVDLKKELEACREELVTRMREAGESRAEVGRLQAECDAQADMESQLSAKEKELDKANEDVEKMKALLDKHERAKSKVRRARLLRHAWTTFLHTTSSVPSPFKRLTLSVMFSQLQSLAPALAMPVNLRMFDQICAAQSHECPSEASSYVPTGILRVESITPGGSRSVGPQSELYDSDVASDVGSADCSLALVHLQMVNEQLRIINRTQREQLQDLESAMSKGSQARRLVPPLVEQNKRERHGGDIFRVLQTTVRNPPANAKERGGGATSYPQPVT